MKGFSTELSSKNVEISVKVSMKETIPVVAVKFEFDILDESGVSTSLETFEQSLILWKE